MNKAVLIDPYAGKISDVVVNDYKDISKHLQCSIFSGAGYTEDGDSIYVNDEGLYDEHMFVDMPDLIDYPYPLAGRVLLLGLDHSNGESTDAFLSAEDVADIDHAFRDRLYMVANYG